MACRMSAGTRGLHDFTRGSPFLVSTPPSPEPVLGLPRVFWNVCSVGHPCKGPPNLHHVEIRLFPQCIPSFAALNTLEAELEPDLKRAQLGFPGGSTSSTENLGKYFGLLQTTLSYFKLLEGL